VPFCGKNKEAEIKNLLNKHISKSAIARILGVHRLTVTEFVKEME
jgi:DNA-binding CsgD family transcriptional regulator